MSWRVRQEQDDDDCASARPTDNRIGVDSPEAMEEMMEMQRVIHCQV